MSEKMTTSEPTTGEIVRALRCDGDANNCVNCSYATYDTATILCDQGQNVRDAADRLESQEAQIKQLTEALAYANEWHKESVENATNELRELSGITGELERFRAFHERYAEQTSKKYINDICALTARAESAERERDAAFDMLQDMRNCDECKHLARTWKEEPCNCCCREYSMFELCGLPQDGEGKENG